MLILLIFVCKKFKPVTSLLFSGLLYNLDFVPFRLANTKLLWIRIRVTMFSSNTNNPILGYFDFALPLPRISNNKAKLLPILMGTHGRALNHFWDSWIPGTPTIRRRRLPYENSWIIRFLIIVNLRRSHHHLWVAWIPNRVIVLLCYPLGVL